MTKYSIYESSSATTLTNGDWESIDVAMLNKSVKNCIDETLKRLT